MAGFIQDLGRVFSSSGLWIRNRSTNDSNDDSNDASSNDSNEFSPLNSFSLPRNIIPTTNANNYAVVYVANSTVLTAVQDLPSFVFPYACEFVGKP